jgi:hypothetical protein
MTIFPQTDCCTLLGIDPKTLRNWLRHANLQFATHPTDARLKCLTQAQVQQLAALHGRPLSSLLTAHPAQEHETLPPSAPASLPSSAMPETDLGQSLVRLQAQVATMQEQLTQLALQLLREREFRLEWREQHHQYTEARLSTLEALVTPAGQRCPSPQAGPSTSGTDLPRAQLSRERRSPLSESARGRCHVLPLIASTATGAYVVICPTKGELPFPPASPEWFDWLATLNSFRFVGRQGRLSAYRNPGRSCWMAYRRIHGHRYEYALGHTKLLTIDRLERMAATLQSHAPAL